MLSPHAEPSAERVRELFDQALDLEPAALGAFLDEACAADESLRAMLESLFHSARAAGGDSRWTPAILVEAAASTSAAAPVLDRYRLKGRLGAGGMGVVYRAERSDGAPIDKYVRERKPSRRELVELFRKICGAVSYAHCNLVVHRDLKPSNILVDAGGEPKLLDFGVAKLLDKAEAATRTRALTPEYASPEQISGAPVTTPSDVYSLGAILYELIAGRSPYRATTSVMDLAFVICKEQPAAPGPEFGEDLANIVMMVLWKEPERRYASAEQLSDDLRRWLEGYPVSARADTRPYRIP